MNLWRKSVFTLSNFGFWANVWMVTEKQSLTYASFCLWHFLLLPSQNSKKFCKKIPFFLSEVAPIAWQKSNRFYRGSSYFLNFFLPHYLLIFTIPTTWKVPSLFSWRRPLFTNPYTQFRTLTGIRICPNGRYQKNRHKKWQKMLLYPWSHRLSFDFHHFIIELTLLYETQSLFDVSLLQQTFVF